MDGHETEPFNQQPDKLAANHFKLIMARKLQAIWTDVLQEPIPPDLQALLDRLEQRRPPAETGASGESCPP
jgi:hypothetical protein